jgi:hypothetical protein
MAKSNYTEAPWRRVNYKEHEVKRKGHLIIESIGRNKKNIASVIPCFGMEDNECEANAKLIAAAPDLLEGIREIQNYLTGETIEQNIAIAYGLCEGLILKATE